MSDTAAPPAEQPATPDDLEQPGVPLAPASPPPNVKPQQASTAGGLYGGAPIDSTTEEQIAPSLVPSTTGQVLGATIAGAFADSPTVGLVRNLAASGAEYGVVDPETGEQVAPPEASVPKDQLNKDYGIPGVLSFDHDMPASVAQSLNEHHMAEIQRADILQRNQGGLLSGGAARFATSTAVGLLDPLNLAAAFVPGVPEARIAGLLGDEALGAGGRAAVRALSGATQGVAGQAALLPLQYGLAKSQQDDWDMGTALSSLAFGAASGGLLHAGIGAFADRGGQLPAWSKIAQQPPELQDAMFRGGMAALSEDRPIDVAGAVDVHDALSSAQELQGWASQQDRITQDFETGENQNAAAAQGIQGRQDQLDALRQPIEERITGLRADAENYRNGLDDVQGQATRAQMDPDTQARLDEIDKETQGTIPASRRLDLEAERTMLTEGAPQPGDVDVLRDAQEAQGLRAAGQRVSSQLDAATARIEKLKAAGADLEQEATDNARQHQLATSRIDSREGVTRDLAARTFRRYAGRSGVELAPGEAEGMARDVLTAKPGDAKGIIAEHLNGITARSPRAGAQLPTELPTAADVRGHVTNMQQVAQAGAAELAAAHANLPSAEQMAVSRNVDNAIKEAPAISGAPSQIEQDIASADALSAKLDEMIKVEKAAGRWDAADDAALARIDENYNAADGDAKAYAEAAACLVNSMVRNG